MSAVPVGMHFFLMGLPAARLCRLSKASTFDEFLSGL